MSLLEALRKFGSQRHQTAESSVEALWTVPAHGHDLSVAGTKAAASGGLLISIRLAIWPKWTMRNGRRSRQW